MAPVRQVVTRSPKRTVGLINCPWFQDRPIEHESRLEKHFVYRALLFPGLATIEHQPFKLLLKKPRQSYTPDFLLTFANGQRLVVEVKRSEKIKTHRERFDVIAALLAERELPFFVVHQGQIDGDFRAQRAGLIRRYAMFAVKHELIEGVITFVNRFPAGVSIGKVIKTLRISEHHLYHLLARRYISADRRTSLSPDDLVYPIHKEITNAAHQFGNWFGCAPWRANT